MSNELHVYAISDSLGETAYAIAEAASVQFPNADFKIQRYPLIKTVSLVQGKTRSCYHRAYFCRSGTIDFCK